MGNGAIAPRLKPPRPSSTLPQLSPDRAILREELLTILEAQDPVASEDAWEAGTFAGCGCSEELISVGLGMMPRWLRAAAARVMRARRGPRRRVRAGWRRGPSLGRPDRPTPSRF